MGPGPATDPLTDLHYVWVGVGYLQHLLERAAVHLLSGNVSLASFYLQQMPYTCYMNGV